MSLNHTELLPISIFRGRDSMTTTSSLILRPEDPLIDMTFITTYTGMTDKWFYKLIRDGRFPKPIKLGRSSRWYKSEVQNWMQQAIADSRGA
ncbi:TPA: AlpA family transcriptional regulator [Klebsiella oxytoca]|nr:AlpA family transcriptional regulator [Klebsiella oxytoca]ELD4400757.1 AlpA family transcriptional regulator [Klebsiella oxytoca]HCF8140163.1 AlpA family transcriptional regulator [Klebsiella oxytoca]HEC2030455.1 AlpA family transcriptional regulator [Klebsiella oxytoca]